MALLKCEDCGREVSSKAPACPHCGCPVPGLPSDNSVDDKPTDQETALPAAWSEASAKALPSPPPNATSATSPKKVVAWVGAIIITLLLIRACTAAGSSEPAASIDAPVPAIATAAPPAQPSGPSEADKLEWAAQLIDENATASSRLKASGDLIANFPLTEEGKKAAAIQVKLQQAVDYDNAGRQWSYDSQEEGMTGKSVRNARVTSTNAINLDFPYAGAQRATLTLRRHPRWGNDVMLSIEQGQILCHTYGDCDVRVRFDDGKLLSYNGTPPADNSSEYVFIPAFGTFTKQLPKAKVAKVEIQIYQAGNQVFEFDVSGFKPEKFK